MTGPELHAARKELRLIQEDLGKLCGKSRQAVAYWETGRLPVPGWMPTFLDGLRAQRGQFRPATIAINGVVYVRQPAATLGTYNGDY